MANLRWVAAERRVATVHCSAKRVVQRGSSSSCQRPGRSEMSLCPAPSITSRRATPGANACSKARACARRRHLVGTRRDQQRGHRHARRMPVGAIAVEQQPAHREPGIEARRERLDAVERCDQHQPLHRGPLGGQPHREHTAEAAPHHRDAPVLALQAIVQCQHVGGERGFRWAAWSTRVARIVQAVDGPIGKGRAPLLDAEGHRLGIAAQVQHCIARVAAANAHERRSRIGRDLHRVCWRRTWRGKVDHPALHGEYQHAQRHIDERGCDERAKQRAHRLDLQRDDPRARAAVLDQQFAQ